jgi:hypothetical protein
MTFLRVNLRWTEAMFAGAVLLAGAALIGVAWWHCP